MIYCIGVPQITLFRIHSINIDFPDLTNQLFRREIKLSGFKFVKGRGHTAIISRDDVSSDRIAFLREISS